MFRCEQTGELHCVSHIKFLISCSFCFVYVCITIKSLFYWSFSLCESVNIGKQKSVRLPRSSIEQTQILASHLFYNSWCCLVRGSLFNDQLFYWHRQELSLRQTRWPGVQFLSAHFLNYNNGSFNDRPVFILLIFSLQFCWLVVILLLSVSRNNQ